MTLDLDAFKDFALDEKPEPGVIERLRFDDALEIPHQLTDLDMWLNFTNEDLYELDKAVREIIKKTRWARESRGKMKTAVPLVFAQIFGRKMEPKDSYVAKILHRLLRYYCTKYTGRSMIQGQRFTHVYHFSKYSCRQKRPLSLRLRLEEADDAGAKSNFREYRPRNSKRAKSRRGATPHGPLADE